MKNTKRSVVWRIWILANGASSRLSVAHARNTNSRAQVQFCHLPSYYVAQLNVCMVISSLADCDPVIYTYISISQITKDKRQKTKMKLTDLSIQISTILRSEVGYIHALESPFLRLRFIRLSYSTILNLRPAYFTPSQSSNWLSWI
jgi:hypothetical protein